MERLVFIVNGRPTSADLETQRKSFGKVRLSMVRLCNNVCILLFYIGNIISVKIFRVIARDKMQRK